MNFQLDPIDLVRFAPVALRLCNKKGYLNIKKNVIINGGLDDHRTSDPLVTRVFVILYGNLLYCLESDSNTDPANIIDIIYLESSTMKISKTASSATTKTNGKSATHSVTHTLSIFTAGGRNIIFMSSNGNELQEWQDMIESSKYVTMSRKLDDNDARCVQLTYQVESQEVLNAESENTIQKLRKQLTQMEEKCTQQTAKISQLESDYLEVKKQLKTTEIDRLLLLKSRGVSPKKLPLWALSETPRDGIKDVAEKIRIWTGTWNLGSNEPFAGMEKERAKRLLLPFIPAGYDMYVIGVQECVSEAIFECFDSLLLAEGCRRLKLDSFSSNTNNNGATEVISSSNDFSKLYGRSEGTLLSLKFTGIAVYVNASLGGDVNMLQVTNFPFSSVQSRGGVAVALNVFGRTVVFINSQLDASDHVLRREQYETLFIQLGQQLGEHGYHLNEQFHHIIWFGDMNYRLVDKSGNPMPVETALKMLEDGRLCRTLFDAHDHLIQEKKAQLVFYGYREPTPFPNFFPTYKKIENRPPVDYSNADWVKNTYRTHYKEPFYKGGYMKEWTPGFCDRVFFYSMVDLAEDLVPETIETDMNIIESTGVADPQSFTSSQILTNLATQSNSPKAPRSMRVTIDNYQSVNDGEGMVSSDHSPVFATFILRVRHDYEKLVQDSQENRTIGSIETVFSALNLNNQTPQHDSISPTHPINPINISNGHTYLNGFNKNNEIQSPSSLTLIPPYITTPTPTSALTESLTLSNDKKKLYKYSLLPPGTYKIRITNIKLLWGANDETPTHISLLFPTPYEAVAGERFTDFRSEYIQLEPSTDSILSFKGANPLRGGGVNDNKSQSMRLTSPLSSSLTSDQSSRFNASRSLKVKTVPTPVEEGDTSKLLFLPGLVDDPKYSWSKVGPSKTGTCLRLQVSTPNISWNRSCEKIPPLQLIWKGNEPLDKLHIALK
eukprot:gene16185-22010_t